MGLIVINSGLVEGDGTGDHGKVMVDKIKTMFAELYARMGDGLLEISLSAASTDNFDPGAPFPSGIITLAFTVTTVAVARLTGLKAGIPGQVIFIENRPASTGELELGCLDTGSLAANRFDGYGDVGLPPGLSKPLQYQAGTINKWAM